jgi:hypothetical protein
LFLENEMLISKNSSFSSEMNIEQFLKENNNSLWQIFLNAKQSNLKKKKNSLN